MRIARWIIGTAAVGGVAVFGAVGAFDDDTKRDDSGTITAAGGLGAFVVRVGDCIQLPDDAVELIVSVEGVPCDSPHDAQAYATFDLSDMDTYDPLRVEALAQEECLARWQSAVGTVFEDDPQLDAFSMHPTRTGWAAGDRGTTCFLVAIDGSRLLESKLPGS